ncbi:MAG: restriction endonuclease subunit S [Alistipes indistinctus]
MKTNEKDTKRGVVPPLRFPEFHGSKGWDLKPLSDYLTEYRQKSDGRSKVHSVSLSKGIVNQIEYLGRSFSADDTSHYKLVKPYDIVYTKSPTGDFPYGIVKQNFNPYNVIVSPLYGVFTPNNQYIGYIIHSFFESAIRLNNYLSTLVQKGAKNTIQISNDTFISKEILLPDNEDEQQKIAECLSSIDTLIKVTGNKIDELKAHKKGLMQQLFPTEGKTVPELRFPEFQQSKEWSVKRLNELASRIIKKNRQGYIRKVLTNSAAEGVVNQAEYFDRNIVNQDNLQNYYVIENGDYVYNPRISTLAPVGPISKNLIGQGIMSPLYTIFRFMDNNNEFYNQYFKTTYWHKYLKDIANQGARFDRMSITADDFMNMPLPYPCPKEQQKIADCLSSIDDLISTQANRLEALKTHKKGLMQQLFPII